MDTQKSALAHFIHDVGKTTAWWYGINIQGSDGNSLAALLGVSQEQLMGLLREIGWVKKSRGATQAPSVSVETIKSFIQQYGLSNVAETTRIVYKKKNNCCFLRIGCFSPSSVCLPPVTKIVNKWERPTIERIGEKQDRLHEEIGIVVSSPSTKRAPLQTNQLKHQEAPQSNTTNSRKNVRTQRNLVSLPATSHASTNTGMDSKEDPFSSFDSSIDDRVAENQMIRAIIDSQLLPKIFKSEHRQKNYWLETDSFAENTADTIINLASMLTKRREERMCELIGIQFMSPKDSVNLPTLRKYSIDPTNKRLIGGLVRDLVTLSQSSAKHDLLTAQMDNGKYVSLVRIPKSVDEASMRRNDAETNWVKQLLVALGRPKRPRISISLLINDVQGDQNEVEKLVRSIVKERERNKQEWSDEELTVRNLIGHLGKLFPKALLWALEKHHGLVGAIHPIIDEIRTFAMWSDANVKYTQAQIISRDLRVWFGKSILSSTLQLKKKLTNNNPRQFVKPECFTHKFRMNSEVVDWSIRDPVKLLLFFLDGVFNRKKTQVCWQSVDVVVSCDHGKGFSRAHAVFICRQKNTATGEWNEYSDSYSVAQAKCKKDSYEILEQTFMPRLNAGLNAIKQKGGFDVWKRKASNECGTEGTETTNDENTSSNQQYNPNDGDQPGGEDDEEDAESLTPDPFYTALTGSPPKNETDDLIYRNISLELFSAGDLSQLMTNYGREGMGSYWCCYCDLAKDQWQQQDHTKGTYWTLPRLAEQVEYNKTIQGDTGNDRKKKKGVKTKPLLPSIEILFSSIPLLHLMLGVINKMESSLVECLQAGCKKYTELYLQLERALQLKIMEEKQLSEKKKIPETKLAALQKAVKAMKAVHQQPPIELKQEIELVGKELAQYRVQEKQLATEIKCQRQAFLGEAAVDENTKRGGQRFRAEIESIYKKFGINKAAFHGGDLQGPACRTLMTKRHQIFSEIWAVILDLPTEQKLVEDETIKEVLDGYERLLGHFDAIFSICRKKRHHLQSDDCSNLGQHIDCACLVWRGLGLSITPKMHIIEDHLLDFTTRLDGIGDLGEDEGERAHPTGSLLEYRLKSLNHEAKATAAAQMEAMVKDEQVKERLVSVRKKAERKRKKCNDDDKAITTATQLQQDRKKLWDEGQNNLLMMPLQTGNCPRIKEIRKINIIKD